MRRLRIWIIRLPEETEPGSGRSGELRRYSSTAGFDSYSVDGKHAKNWTIHMGAMDGIALTSDSPLQTGFFSK